MPVPLHLPFKHYLKHVLLVPELTFMTAYV